MKSIIDWWKRSHNNILEVFTDEQFDQFIKDRFLPIDLSLERDKKMDALYMITQQGTLDQLRFPPAGYSRTVRKQKFVSLEDEKAYHSVMLFDADGELLTYSN